MNISAYIFSLLLAYQLPVIFLGAFFFGETVIIAAAFLAAQGAWSLPMVFLLAFLGTVLSDLVWFLFGQRFLLESAWWQRQHTKYAHVLSGIHHRVGNKPFLILLFIKFLYGTRVLTIMYLSLQKLRVSTFLLFDAIGTVLWLCVMIALGWFAERGLSFLIPAFEKVSYTLTFLVLLLFAFRFVMTWFNKEVTKL